MFVKVHVGSPENLWVSELTGPIGIFPSLWIQHKNFSNYSLKTRRNKLVLSLYSFCKKPDWEGKDTKTERENKHFLPRTELMPKT